MTDPQPNPLPQPGRSGILARLWQAILRGRDALWGLVLLLWLCAYATVASLGIAALFLITGQGEDLLRISAEKGASLWNLGFLVGALLLGLTLWYTARLLLARDYRDDPVDRSRFAPVREWLPRFYGTLVPLSIGVGLLRVGTEAGRDAWVLGALFLLLAALLVLFLVKRRALFLGGSRRGIEEPIEGLDLVNWVLIVVSMAASFALLAGFVAAPVTLPQAIGTPAIVLLGFAGIALFGGLVLTYAFLVNRQPAGTTFVLVLAAIFGLWNDNHWIRVDDLAPALARRQAPDHYRVWRDANPGFTPVDGREPVILVAASGGGIRAAYWTAITLASLEAIPGFRDNLFALSGVSGGSVGAAVYAAVKRRQLEGQPAAGAADTLGEVRRVLSQDFLSPVVAGFLFPDLVQRFLPVPVPAADRQRFLELGFERALSAGENPLSRSFTALYAGGYELRLPSLLLNTTVVDSGRRAVLSNIDLVGFTDTLDLLGDGFSTRQIRLSAAAGASARFTYLSPAGSLTGPGEHGEQKIRVVDGGYFENSGAATVADLLGQIDPLTLEPPAAVGPRIFPILILIRNDPAAPAVCQGRGTDPLLGPGPVGPPANDVLSEVASPVRALLNARTARGRLAEVDAATRVETGLGGAVIEVSLAAILQDLLRTTPEPAARAQERIQRAMVEPPLGWALSAAARDSMDRTMAQGGGSLGDEFAILRAVLAGGTGGYKPCMPR